MARKSRPQHSLTAKAGRLAVYQFGSRFVDLGVTIVLARILMPADFGVVAAATIFIAVAQLVVEIGIGATIIQLPDLSDRDLRVAGTLVWGNSLLYFALTQLFAGAAGSFMGSADVTVAIRALAFTFPVQAFGIVSEALLVKRLEAVRVARLQLISKGLVVGGLGVVLALSGWGWWSIVIPNLVGTFVKAVWIYAIARPPIRPLYDRDSARRLLRKGAGFSASRVINFVATRGDNTMVGHFFNPTVLGFYSRAYSLMNLPTDLYATLADRLVFPALAKAQNNPAKLRDSYLRGVEMTALVGMPLSIASFCFGPEFIKVVLGNKWIPVIEPFQILAVATYFRLGMRISASVQRAKGAVGAMIWVQVLYAALVVGGCFVAYRFGLDALCVAVSAGVIVAYVAISWSGMALTETSLRDYLARHRSGALMAVLVLAVAIPIAYAGRHYSVSPFLIMAAFALAMTGVCAALLFVAPPGLLGHAGSEIAASLRNWIRRRLTRRGGSPA